MKVKLYVEGGGDGCSLKSRCREGFREFFLKTRLKQRMPKIIACGGRKNTYDTFRAALANAKDGEFVALLVDSESRVIVKNKPWLHLNRRRGDQWKRPREAGERNVHLMVQVMESWFLADRDALAEYFGQHFRASALPAQRDVEKIDKKDVLDGLSAATKACVRDGYNKGDHSFAILAKVSADKVTSASPHAARLVETLVEEASK